MKFHHLFRFGNLDRGKPQYSRSQIEKEHERRERNLLAGKEEKSSEEERVEPTAVKERRGVRKKFAKMEMVSDF